MNPEILNQLPPQDLDAEKSVLGAIMLKPDVLDDIGSKLRTEDFYHSGHGILYRHLRDMNDDRIAIDATTVLAKLRATGDLERLGGAAIIGEILQSVPYAENAVFYAELVVKASRRRAMITTATNLLRDSYDVTQEPNDVLNRAEASLSAIEAGDSIGEPVSAWDVAREALERIDLIQQRGQSAGIMTGLTDFDRYIGGLFAEELIILAARPGIGKTALAMQIGAHNANKDRPVYFASLEMSRVELITRLMCSESGVNSRAVRTATLTENDQRNLVQASAKISSMPLYIHDNPQLTVYDIRRAARKQKRDGLDLLIVDYLQLIKPENPRDPRHEQIGLITRQLKAIARELKVPVLCLCQLNRAADKEGHAKLSHLKDSGSIEQDADVVLMLQRQFNGAEVDEKDKVPKLIVEKNRNGETGAFTLEWIASETRYQCPQPKGDPCFAEYANENRPSDF